MFYVSKDDRVIDILGRVGEVTSVYPEINVAVVKFDSGDYEKVSIDILSPYREIVPEPERKKAGLLEKVKGRLR